MNIAAERPLEPYKRLEIERGVPAASAQKLIAMLHAGAIESAHSARLAVARGDDSTRMAMISKAVAIIHEGLRPAVDPVAGGKAAQDLLALYDYLANRLLYANLKCDEPSLEQVISLLTELKSAWDAIERQAHRRSAARAPSAARDIRAVRRGDNA